MANTTLTESTSVDRRSRLWQLMVVVLAGLLGAGAGFGIRDRRVKALEAGVVQQAEGEILRVIGSKESVLLDLHAGHSEELRDRLLEEIPLLVLSVAAHHPSSYWQEVAFCEVRKTYQEIGRSVPEELGPLFEGLDRRNACAEGRPAPVNEWRAAH